MSVYKYTHIPCSCWFLCSSHGILQVFVLDPWLTTREYLFLLQQKLLDFADVSTFKLASHGHTLFISASTLYEFSQISILSYPFIFLSSSQVYFCKHHSVCNPVQECVLEAASPLTLSRGFIPSIFLCYLYCYFPLFLLVSHF